MRGPSLDNLSAFLAVVEHGNLTKAAEHSGVSSPTLSRSIRTLEEQLGIRLLNRTTRSVSLTKAGEHLLERLRPMTEAYKTALESMSSFRDKPAGLLRILVWPGVAQYVFLPKVSQFLAQYPDISIEISLDANVTDIVAAQFDAGVHNGDQIDYDMIAIRISEKLHGATFASPAYLARRSKPVVPADLKTHDCIRFRKASGALVAWHFQEDGKTREIDVPGRLIVPDPVVGIRAALDGVGIAHLSKEVIAPLVAEGKLVLLLEEYVPPPANSIFLYYPSKKQVPAHLQAFIDYFKKGSKNCKAGLGLVNSVGPHHLA